MEYREVIKLKDGRECIIRNGTKEDGEVVFEIFNSTHEQTDFLLSYTDENSMNAEEEGEFLQQKTENEREIELIAEVDGKIVACAGIEAVGHKDKVKHRADFGISVDQAYWGLGIGSALMDANIKIAREAGYSQLELNVVAENEIAIRMYQKAGFAEFGRDPRGFKSRYSGYQELLYMRLELD